MRQDYMVSNTVLRTNPGLTTQLIDICYTSDNSSMHFQYLEENESVVSAEYLYYAI